MKIVIWNVMNGVGRPEQINLFNSLEPDLAILPELKEKNINALKPNDAVWITNNHENNSPKGLGLLSFNQTSLSPLSRDEDMEIYILVSVHNPSYKFDLLGVWNRKVALLCAISRGQEIHLATYQFLFLLRFPQPKYIVSSTDEKQERDRLKPSY